MIGQRSEWDIVILGGIEVPGVCVVKGVKHGRKIDVRSPPGSDGASVTDKGLDVGEFEITVTLATRDQLADFELDILPMVDPPEKSANRKPLSIVHPATRMRGINAIYPISTVGPDLANGLWTFSIKCIKWFLPTKANKTTTPSSDWTIGPKETGPVEPPARRDLSPTESKRPY